MMNTLISAKQNAKTVLRHIYAYVVLMQTRAGETKPKRFGKHDGHALLGKSKKHKKLKLTTGLK